MNELQIFNDEELGSIRTVTIEREHWFVGKDVAEILGYSNTRKALADHVDEEDKIDGVTIRDSIGREQNPICINESGLYSLILSSKLPTAKKFKRWVTSEVLPSIRKHGVYAIDEVLQTPDMLIAALTELKAEKEKTKALKMDCERMKPKEIFADAVSASKTSILVGELAKILSQRGIQIGQNRLFHWLRESGYLMKSGSSKNMPTQRSMEQGLFEVKETVINHSDGHTSISKTTKVTGKGQIYFVNKFLGTT